MAAVGYSRKPRFMLAVVVDADGVPWVLELDTCPGLTETSLLPLAAEKRERL